MSVRTSISYTRLTYKGLVTSAFHSSSGNLHRNMGSCRTHFSRLALSSFCYSDQRSALYSPFGLSLETGLFSPPVTKRLCGLWPYLLLSCGHHPAAFRVIPFFRRSSIAPATNAVLSSASLRHNITFFAIQHSRAISRLPRRALPWVSSWFFPNAGVPTAARPKAFVSQSG